MLVAQLREDAAGSHHIPPFLQQAYLDLDLDWVTFESDWQEALGSARLNHTLVHSVDTECSHLECRDLYLSWGAFLAELVDGQD